MKPDPIEILDAMESYQVGTDEDGTMTIVFTDLEPDTAYTIHVAFSIPNPDNDELEEASPVH